MEHLTSILVAVDLSPCSRSALAQAARLAGRSGATLHVLHVVETRVVEDLEEMLPHRSGTREGIVADASKALEKFVAGAEASLEVVVGSPLDAILEKTRAVAADLLVIGAYGMIGAGRGAGSLALQLARKSPVNVLLVDARHTSAFESALVGIDFSEHSLRALDEALLVARLERCPLHAVHVFAAPWYRLHYRAPTPQASPDYQHQFHAALQGRLDAVVSERKKAAGKVEVTAALVEHTSYAQGILDYARQRGIDLVVVGTLGKSNLRYALVGSTAERVVRDSPCSVLAVPPKA
jgi:nucleotide-binding universal stress UspA family protein